MIFLTTIFRYSNRLKNGHGFVKDGSPSCLSISIVTNLRPSTVKNSFKFSQYSPIICYILHEPVTGVVQQALKLSVLGFPAIESAFSFSNSISISQLVFMSVSMGANPSPTSKTAACIHIFESYRFMSCILFNICDSLLHLLFGKPRSLKVNLSLQILQLPWYIRNMLHESKLHQLQLGIFQ